MDENNDVDIEEEDVYEEDDTYLGWIRRSLQMAVNLSENSGR